MPGDASFDRLLKCVEDGRYEPGLVCRIEDGAIVGLININEIVRALFQSGYLGYAAVAAYAGQGYMREGLELVLKRAFSELGLHRLGGRWRDHERWAIRAEQWRARPSRG